jgi:hypothetical protein
MLFLHHARNWLITCGIRSSNSKQLTQLKTLEGAQTYGRKNSCLSWFVKDVLEVFVIHCNVGLRTWRKVKTMRKIAKISVNSDCCSAVMQSVLSSTRHHYRMQACDIQESCPCDQIWGVCGNGSTSPLILKFDISWRRVVGFTPRIIYLRR